MSRLRCAAFLGALAWFASASPCSADAADPLLARYAAALRTFDARLPADRAVRLAARVVADADAAGLDARFIVALIAVESSWRSEAVSPAGARGLGQLMPATAAALGVDPDDPEANVDGTVAHVRTLFAHYTAVAPNARAAIVLAAYNAGAGAVARYGGIPPYAETRAYVQRVLALWRRLAGA